VLFYSVVMGAFGPVLAFGVPPIREHFGYRPPELIPTTYPRASFSLTPSPFFPFPRAYVEVFLDVYIFSLFESIVPKRPRRPVQGYEDEE
jgi:hypothetical protein